MSALETSITHSALGWVKKSIDDNLSEVKVDLRRYIENADETLLDGVKQRLTMIEGVLVMIEQYGAAMLTEEMVALVDFIVDGKPEQRDPALEILLRAVLQLPDYLEHIQSGHRDIPIAILPLLNDIRAVRNQDLFSEKLLFLPDLSMHESAADSDAIDEDNNQASRLLAKKLRPVYQLALLNVIRDTAVDESLQRLARVCATLEERSASEQMARIWWIIGALIESVSRQQLELGVSIKNLLGKVDALFRVILIIGERGLLRHQPIELIKNFLYYIAQPECDGPRAQAIKTAYRLEQFLPSESARSEVLSNIAGPNQALLKTVAEAMKADIETVKSTLEVYVNGDLTQVTTLKDLPQEMHIISDTLAMIGLGQQRQLIEAQIEVVKHIVSGERAADEEQLLSMAAELLQVEQALDQMQKRQPVDAGQPPREADVSRAYELDSVLSAVVTAALDDVHKSKDAIIEFVKNPERSDNIDLCIALMSESRGALMLLERERAVAVVDGLLTYLDARDRARFVETKHLEALSQVVASLEYYLEALGERRGDADSILDLADSRLRQLLDGVRDRSAQAQSDSVAATQVMDIIEKPAADADAEPELDDTLVVAKVADTAVDADAVIQARDGAERPTAEAGPGASLEDTVVISGSMDRATAANASAQVMGSGKKPPAEADPESSLEDTVVVSRDTGSLADADASSQALNATGQVQANADDAWSGPEVVPVDEELEVLKSGSDPEILDIYLEEAAEEAANIARLQQDWMLHPEDENALKNIRRAFHTIKGSGRLVGATKIGEFAWEFEQLLNRVIDRTVPPSKQVIHAVGGAARALPELVSELKTFEEPRTDIAHLRGMARALAEFKTEELLIDHTQTMSMVESPYDHITDADSPDDTGEPPAQAEPADQGYDATTRVNLPGESTRQRANEIEPQTGHAETVTPEPGSSVQEPAAELPDEIESESLRPDPEAMQSGVSTTAPELSNAMILDDMPDERQTPQRKPSADSADDTGKYENTELSAGVAAPRNMQERRRVETNARAETAAAAASARADASYVPAVDYSSARAKTDDDPAGEGERATKIEIESMGEDFVGDPPDADYAEPVQFESVPELAELEETDAWQAGRAEYESDTNAEGVEANDAGPVPGQPVRESTPRPQVEEVATESAAEAEAEDIAMESVTETEAEEITMQTLAGEEAEDIAMESVTETEAEEITMQTPDGEESEDIAMESVTEEEAEQITMQTLAGEESEDIVMESVTEEEAEQITMQTLAGEESEDIAMEFVTEEEAEEITMQTLAGEESEDIALESVTEEEAEQITMQTQAGEQAEEITMESARNVAGEYTARDPGEEGVADDENIEFEAIDPNFVEQGQNAAAATTSGEAQDSETQRRDPPDPFAITTARPMSDAAAEDNGSTAPGQPEPTGLSFDPELLTIYQQEVEQHLDIISSVLDRAEKTGELVPSEDLYRALHTIHGASRTADITSIGELAGLLEKPLKSAIAQEMALDHEIVALYREGQRALSQLTAQLVATRQMPVIPRELQISLRALAEDFEEHTVDLTEDESSQTGDFVDTLTMLHESGDMEQDSELLAIFVDEASDLLDMSDNTLHQWSRQDSDDPGPQDYNAVMELQRYLHTLKGGARMAELKQISNLSHEMESLFIAVIDGHVERSDSLTDLLKDAFDLLHRQVAQARRGEEMAAAGDMIAALRQIRLGGKAVEADNSAESSTEPGADSDNIDIVSENLPGEPLSDADSSAQDVIKVRADLLDNLVSSAGEVSIYRARMEQQVAGLGSHLGELGQTIARLKSQLRSLEAETDAQIHFSHRTENRRSGEFDPLEMDRYTMIQELSRSLSESVNDLSSLQSMLGEQVRDSETLLLQQSRVNTDLQDGLIKSRMVKFSGLLTRLRRLVRQSSQELGKKAELVVTGEQNEVDNKVLDRMVAPLEHIIRNALSHGIETPVERVRKGKVDTGRITIDITRDGSDVVIQVSDDGAGVDIEKVRSRAMQLGLLEQGHDASETDLVQYILEPGFSTAEHVTQLSGRGVGMDVVDIEIKQLGGTLQIETTPQGTTFIARLPFTLSINQAILVRCGEETYAIPLLNIEGITRLEAQQMHDYYRQGRPELEYAGQNFALHNLARLVGAESAFKPGDSEKQAVILSRSGDIRVALHVDEIIGNREIVVKNLGKQLSQVKSLAGASILADGSVVLILDVGGLMRQYLGGGVKVVYQGAEAGPGKLRDTVMVVDDSITMRRIASKLLERNNYEVITAKDGVDALAQLQDVRPDVLLLDIEMPRMDGFELATHMQNEASFSAIPIIMITSRTGEKHRDRAFEIGVTNYMGKPYQEEELIRNIKTALGGR